MIEKHLQRVAILIPTYNGAGFIKELFESIARDSYPKEHLGIFVVDNASTDNTVVQISNFSTQGGSASGGQFPISKITVIQNDRNYFFAKAINQAAVAAIHAGYEYLILLNQDTTVEVGWIEALLKTLSTDESIAVAQARMMLSPSSCGIVNSLGNRIHYLGFGFSSGNGKAWNSVEGHNTRAYWEVLYASGGAMMIRAKVWVELGGLDEHLIMYHEDLALGWQLALRGKRSVCVRDAVVYHKYNFNPEAYKYYFMERNRLIVIFEYYKIPTLLLLTPILLGMEAGLLGFAFVKGWWKEKFRSYASIIASLLIIIRKRHSIQSTRLVRDRVILGQMANTIEDQPIDHWLLRTVANPLMRWYYRMLMRMIWW